MQSTQVSPTAVRLLAAAGTLALLATGALDSVIGLFGASAVPSACADGTCYPCNGAYCVMADPQVMFENMCFGQGCCPYGT